MNKSATFGFRRKPPGHAAAAEAVRAWTRARFGLGDDSTVMVAEVTCAVPGCEAGVIVESECPFRVVDLGTAFVLSLFTVWPVGGTACPSASIRR